VKFSNKTQSSFFFGRFRLYVITKLAKSSVNCSHRFKFLWEGSVIGNCCQKKSRGDPPQFNIISVAESIQNPRDIQLSL